MVELYQSAIKEAVNQRRPGNLPPWDRPIVLAHEDVAEHLFDVLDPKTGAESAVCAPGQGHATYVNGRPEAPYNLRIIHNEAFFNGFNIRGEGDWARGLARPDLLVYDLGEGKEWFVIHELSEGEIRSKRQDAKMQFFRFLQFMKGIDAVWSFVSAYRHMLCVISAKGTPALPATPGGVAEGFMQVYDELPDPLPIQHQGIARLGFEAIQTKVVRLT